MNPLKKLKGLASKGRKLGKKLALGAGVAVAGYGAYKLGKKYLGKKSRAGSLSRLKNRVMRKTLKIKDAQLTRKLFKEQMRVV